MEFLPDSGHAVPRESGEIMSRRPRRSHTPAFKAKVAFTAIKGDQTLAQLAEQFDCRAVRLFKSHKWRWPQSICIRLVGHDALALHFFQLQGDRASHLSPLKH